jgi:hypothetical protein
MPSNKLKKIAISLVLIIICAGFAVGAKAALAQQDFGFDYAGNLPLGTRDLRSIIIDIVNIFMGFLGIIAVLVILYGGYVYMTSAGNPEKIEKAKKILINGAVGLAIIFASWGIVALIFRLFGIGIGGGGGGPSGPIVGPGALGNGIIESHYPGRNQRDVPRNTMIAVTFKERIDPASIIEDTNGSTTFGDCTGVSPVVCDELADTIVAGEADAVKIFKNIDGISGALAPDKVTVFTNDNKTFIFDPVDNLGNDVEEFWYTVQLTSEIKKAGGVDQALPFGYSWQFEVSTIIDITPPQIISVIPYPDNSADAYTATTAAQATGSITVVSQPKTYVPASVSAVTPLVGTINASVIGNYTGDEDEDIIIQLLAGETTATVDWSDLDENDRNATNPAPVDTIGRTIPLGGGLTLVIDPGYDADAALNRWTLSATAKVDPDYLRVGNINYQFVDSAPSGDQIEVGADVNVTAANIGTKLDEQAIFETPTVAANVISLVAAVAGSSGNSIQIITDGTRLADTDMTGGVDAGQAQSINDKKDEPRNVVVQINFSEAVNPITTTGEVLILGGGTIGPALASASFDLILPTIDLSGTRNYIAGNWTISNQYRTIEFITLDKCGVNSCGEDVYCLPTDPATIPLIPDLTVGNILIEVKAAFGVNLPTADLPYNGVVDMAANSLDGNRDGSATGIDGDNDGTGDNDGDGVFNTSADDIDDYYNENTGIVGVGDNYMWSFWVNSDIDLTPPRIEEIFPAINGTIGLEEPIEIKFSKLMMSSTLRPDSNYADGKDHLTLIDNSINPVGYWITSTNIDDDLPPDDIADTTRAYINHTPFPSSTNYAAEAGEGIKDLYQNCYMPAADTAGCSGTSQSCCNGVPVANDGSTFATSGCP